MSYTLPQIAEKMRDIDFCTLLTDAGNGAIGGRPMSNNREVDYTGDSWFFTYDDRRMIADIEREASVALAFQGSGGVMGLVGKPGIFIHVQGRAELIRDTAQFAEHWDKSLDRWFPDGPTTAGTIMIRVSGTRVRYWDGEDHGEITIAAAR